MPFPGGARGSGGRQTPLGPLGSPHPLLGPPRASSRIP
ncbi:hypothetical protein [Caudoviricetes sp.]|nr:hypothetical protein [Caudoviricetes sp.]